MRNVSLFVKEKHFIVFLLPSQLSALSTVLLFWRKSNVKNATIFGKWKSLILKREFIASVILAETRWSQLQKLWLLKNLNVATREASFESEISSN